MAARFVLGGFPGGVFLQTASIGRPPGRCGGTGPRQARQRVRRGQRESDHLARNRPQNRLPGPRPADPRSTSLPSLSKHPDDGCPDPGRQSFQRLDNHPGIVTRFVRRIHASSLFNSNPPRALRASIASVIRTAFRIKTPGRADAWQKRRNPPERGSALGCSVAIRDSHPGTRRILPRPPFLGALNRVEFLGGASLGSIHRPATRNGAGQTGREKAGKKTKTSRVRTRGKCKYVKHHRPPLPPAASSIAVAACAIESRTAPIWSRL